MSELSTVISNARGLMQDNLHKDQTFVVLKRITLYDYFGNYGDKGNLTEFFSEPAAGGIIERNVDGDYPLPEKSD